LLADWVTDLLGLVPCESAACLGFLDVFRLFSGWLDFLSGWMSGLAGLMDLLADWLSLLAAWLGLPAAWFAAWSCCLAGRLFSLVGV
jgi:hypothetical protein